MIATDGDKDRPQNLVYFLTGQGIDPENAANSKFDINRTSGEIYVLKVRNWSLICLDRANLQAKNCELIFVITAVGQRPAAWQTSVAVHSVRPGRGWGGSGGLRRRASEPQGRERQPSAVPPGRLFRQRD